ncbi:MAG TPA: tetratricopeptide repeat protein [Oscillatoriaceae cyanobacterium M33_DOE_052]|uniref:Tetratricopeptide repeat protein n=1 Tax=Planktothricoides sp. SpSt-374 TaxID=2282167 RepID=A0A7C4A013_9CYAN|nr:tetratricopeptide repeat protein [Oscillatoriaceae cyanobacterium M33_DOE_052]
MTNDKEPIMISIEEVSAAFESRDYRQAAQLLKVLIADDPRNPWVQFYVGRLYEETNKPEAAAKVYRKLLQQATQPKVLGQARQGLQRLEAAEKERRTQAIAEAKQDPNQRQPGILVLEPINPDRKTEAAQRFAKIVQLQPYSARLLLPTRTWRLYRTGPIGELRFLVSELRQGEIPSFCTTIEAIEALPVFRIQYFHSLSPTPTVICQNPANQLGKLPFQWTEVTQIVEALLPIFKPVAVQNHRRTRTTYKEKTSDYIGMCDLHLPGRNCILRLCQETYQFHQGAHLTPLLGHSLKDGNTKIDSLSSNLKWQTLLKFLKEQIPHAAIWSDFTPFAETALPHSEMLSRITPHIELLRYLSSDWEPAFQLYSSLLLLRPKL